MVPLLTSYLFSKIDNLLYCLKKEDKFSIGRIFCLVDVVDDCLFG